MTAIIHDNTDFGTVHQYAVLSETEPVLRRLDFEGTDIIARDFNGRLWLTAKDIGTALGYRSPSRQVRQLYERHADEFGQHMTQLLTLTPDGQWLQTEPPQIPGGPQIDPPHRLGGAQTEPTPSPGGLKLNPPRNTGGTQEHRLFSSRGCHLLAMLARTDRAKRFRAWVLNVLEGLEFLIDTPPQPEDLGCVWWDDVIAPEDWSPERMTKALGFLLHEWRHSAKHPQFTRERFINVRHYLSLGLETWEVARILGCSRSEVTCIKTALQQMNHDGILFLLDE